MAGAAAIPVFLAACFSAPPEPTAPFERVGSYLTGAHPVAGGMVDLSGDGDLDFVAPALLTNDVVIIENDSTGLIWHQIEPFLVGAGDMIAADVLGEGRRQLIASNRDLNRIDIYSINDAPSIEHIETIAVTGATGLASTDLDGDGDLDLVVTRFRDATLELFMQENGALVRSQTIETSKGPFIVRASDLDSDGAAELVVAAAHADKVEIYVREGVSWQKRGEFETARWPSSIHVGTSTAETSAIFGTATVGDELFRLMVDRSTPSWRANYETIAHADGPFAITETEVAGEAALAVTNKGEGTVSLFVGLGEDELPTESARFTTGEEGGPSPIFSWDYNGDQRPDLAIVNAFSDEVVIFRGR